MTRRLLTLPTATLVGAALVASVLAAPAGATVPTGRSALRVYATGVHKPVVPASVQPGIVHVRNIGRDEMLVLRGLHPRSTRHRAASDLRSDSLRRLESDFRIVGEAVPGNDSYVQLHRGAYLFADVDTRHLGASNIAETVVEGSRVDAVVPASKRVLVTRHKQLHVPYHLARKTWLHIGNRSSALTSFLFIGIASKTTYRMLHAAIEHPSLRGIFRLSKFDLVPLSLVGPHNAAWMHFHASPGRYVAMVLAVSSHTGFPSLHRGQARTVRVR